MRADLATAFQAATGEVSTLHKHIIEHALNVSVTTAADEWSHDTLIEETISYLSVVHSDVGGALHHLEQPTTNE